MHWSLTSASCTALMIPTVENESHPYTLHVAHMHLRWALPLEGHRSPFSRDTCHLDKMWLLNPTQTSDLQKFKGQTLLCHLPLRFLPSKSPPRISFQLPPFPPYEIVYENYTTNPYICSNSRWTTRSGWRQPPTSSSPTIATDSNKIRRWIVAVSACRPFSNPTRSMASRGWYGDTFSA